MRGHCGSKALNRRLTALALALAVLITLIAMTGCHSLAAYPHQPPMTIPVDKGMGPVSLRVIWHDTVDGANDACGKAGRYLVTYGCAIVMRLPSGEGVCTVHAVTPKDWNDQPALKILGHEVAHCFMAGHAEG